MPYLVCPGCGLTVYSPFAHARKASCPECERTLDTAQQTPAPFNPWSLSDWRVEAGKVDQKTP